MSYATSKEIALSEIPVIDMTGLRHGNTDQAIEVASNLRKACEDVGFFYVENHGVSEDIIAAANTAARSFFSSTLEEKQRVAINDSHHGFIKVGEAKMYDGAKIDLKESYVWGDEPAGNDNRFLGPNN